MKFKVLLENMNQQTHISIAFRLWCFTSLTFSSGAFILSLFMGSPENFLSIFFLSLICSAIGSLPALPILFFSVKWLRNSDFSTHEKITMLVFTQLIICIGYGSIVVYLDNPYDIEAKLKTMATVAGVLFGCNCVSAFFNLSALKFHFSDYILLLPSPKWSEAELQESPIENFTQAEQSAHQPILIATNQSNQFMQHNPQEHTEAIEHTPSTSSNKILIKGLITGALILIMLIPTIFISNLVQEREQRQKEVVAEVSNKWANAQTITGPYLLVPYNENVVNEKNQNVFRQTTVVLLPENLNVSGTISAEERPRSIYKVLLYRSNIKAHGVFNIKVPQNIITENLILGQARLCVGIDDFKGIEGPVTVSLNGTAYDLTAGLPSHEIDTNGLSATVALKPEDFKKDLPFSLELKVKGSEQLSFVPLSGNSSFSLQSAWPSPSFDGYTLPTDRTVNEKGFTASWSFNKATLPYNTFSKDIKFDKDSFTFGVSMLQPADQYAKTMRSVKYAILFIGLTFSLFFIIELMQKKPVHPLQYILVGLALVIFYTLLLSISEFILFDFAYLIAATATITLITLYAKSHFQSIKTASVFASVLTALYGFIFVLISLEDTALLVGSIGLFIVLALVMYASRKINWYNPSITNNAASAV